MSAKKNKRLNYSREATGTNFVSKIVEEFFHWGWVQNPQQNDDGIDGIIWVRDNMGRDLGARIQVQIKSGPKYFKGVDAQGRLKIQPYTPIENLRDHLKNYAQQLEPVILVFVTSEWKGKTDMYRPWAWWVRMDDYDYDNSSYVYIDPKQRFGEHSKKELFGLVSKTLKWTEYKTIQASAKDYRLFNSTADLKAQAKAVYDKLRNQEVRCPALKGNRIVFNRIGWHHICNGQRGHGRIRTSFGLMSVVPEIISTANRWILASKSQYSNRNHVFYTLRAVVRMKKEVYKVQVIVRKQTNMAGTDKYVFYSVHILNK